jgi:hypothetical protein
MHVRTRLVLVALAGITVLACRGRTPTEQPNRTKPVISMIKSWDAKGKVAAVSSDGALIVQRGDNVEIFSPVGAKLGALPIGNPSDELGYRYAVSPGGGTVAFVRRDGMIELWDVARQTRTAQVSAAHALKNTRTFTPLAGPAPVAPQSFGPPRFLRDGRLVTHHDGGVVVWKPDGTIAVAIEDETLSLVRESWSVAENELLLRCADNQPGVANTALFVVSLDKKRVIDRGRPDREGWLRFDDLEVWLGDEAGDRFLWIKNGNAVQRFRTSEEPQLISASPNRARLVWVEQPYGNHLAVVNVLDRMTARIVRLEIDNVPLVSVRLEDQLVTVSEQGAVRTWQLPDFSNADRVDLRTVQEDPREATWQRSLVKFGVGDFAGAAQMTSDMRRPGVPAKYLIGSLYTLSQTRNDGAKTFLSDAKALGIEWHGAAARTALLSLAEDFARAQLVLGGDFLLYWLESGPSARDGDNARAVRIGLELALQASEADQYDLRELLVARLAETFPNDPEVREAMKDQ